MDKTAISSILAGCTDVQATLQQNTASCPLQNLREKNRNFFQHFFAYKSLVSKNFRSPRNNFAYSAVRPNSEILLIQIGDYGPCWAHCIYNLYLKQIHN